MTRLLLDHSVDANIQRDDLQSPLHLASANGHLKIVELLVQRGASVDLFNKKQVNSLYQVVKNESHDRSRPDRPWGKSVFH